MQVNLATEPALREPERLLASYRTLTGLSDALTAAGAAVRVIQRFGVDACVTRAGVKYDFVGDGPPGTPRPWTVFPRVARALGDAAADVVHINGLMFPGMVRAVRRRVGDTCAVVLQDHSGYLPRPWSWPFRQVRAAAWRRALGEADACTFTARELATPWYSVGLEKTTPIFEIPEASTHFVPIDRRDAQRRTGVAGAPAILWVGRLDRNKDPLTVLTALEQSLPAFPGARVTMVAADDGQDRRAYQREEIVRRITASEVLGNCVTLVGPVPHEAMPAYYSAADIFISGSHHEGSGYALIEAMACGVSPCVTAIPAFRALADGCGAMWRAGDAEACAAALRDLLSRDRGVERRAVRERFERAMSWEVIGRRTLEVYSTLLASKRRRGR